MIKKLIITIDDNEEELLLTMDRIHQLISEGYTSGHDPEWEIVEEEQNEV